VSKPKKDAPKADQPAPVPVHGLGNAARKTNLSLGMAGANKSDPGWGGYAGSGVLSQPPDRGAGPLIEEASVLGIVDSLGYRSLRNEANGDFHRQDKRTLSSRTGGRRRS